MNENETIQNLEETTETEAKAAEISPGESPDTSANETDVPDAGEPEKAPVKEKRSPKAESSPKSNASGGMSRKMKRSLVSGFITALVLIAVVMVNVVASVMTEKLPALTADITGMKNFEISDKTREIAENLKRKVTISFLSDRSTYVGIDPYCKQTAILAEAMEKCSDGMLDVNYVDIVRNPSFTSDYTNEDLNTTDIIVTSGSNRRILKVSDMFTFENYSGNYSYITASRAEQVIDNAVLAVSTGEIIKTAVIVDNASEDRTYFESTLRATGYSVTEINIASQDIPEDTQLLVIYTPSKDISISSLNKITAFLGNNGKFGKNLLFIASPTRTDDMPNFGGLLIEYGMSIGEGFAFEADGSRINSSSDNFFDGVLCSYASDLYTSGISDLNRTVIAGYSKPVIIENSITAAPLLRYSEYSGVCPFDADENWSYKDAITGFVPVLAQGTVGSDGNYSSVIVSGSDKIFTRSYYGSDYSNKAYLSVMLATVNGQAPELVNIPEKTITAYDINIDRQTAVNLGFLVYAVIPLIILGAGFTVFLLRKNR